MNIGELLYKGYEELKSKDIDTYKLDCQLLLSKVINKDKLFIMLNRNFSLTNEQVQEFLSFLELRKNNMPIKYIIGSCEFMGLDFFIREGVLIPRPDTEVLVEQVLDIITKNKYHKICDVCCGSGAIGISIAEHDQNALVSCLDISDIAIEVTGINIKGFNLEDRVKVKKSDLLQVEMSQGNKYDVIVSNPPYIRKDVIPTLMKDVRDYEPYEALCGGEDGLYFYRKLVCQGKEILNDKGVLAFEIGYDQKQKVSELLIQNGFYNIQAFKDLSGNDRVVLGYK